MVEAEKYTYADSVAAFLDNEFYRGSQYILDVLQEDYGIDPWSFLGFKAYTVQKTIYFYFLTNETTIEAFEYSITKQQLIHLTELTFGEVSDFIIQSSEESSRLLSARSHGAIGILARALSQLLPLAPQDAGKLLSQLCKQGSAVRKLIHKNK